jgi:fibrillarin-like rRNA methylase
MAQDRGNVVPILADARLPNLYRLMVPMVDVIFSDVAQPDQTEIVMKNAKHYLKKTGEVLIAIKVTFTKNPHFFFLENPPRTLQALLGSTGPPVSRKKKKR